MKTCLPAREIPAGDLGGSDPVKLLFLKAMMLKIRAEMVLE
jgi:hypothetical protein